MKKIKYLLYILSIFVLFTVISCPEPITEDIVAKVEDEGAPTIVVTSPLNNSVYRSSVSFTGTVNDDAKNSIERFSFDVQNRSISGGVTISSGNVSQDSSAGTIPVTYNSSTGNFSFEFSTIDPDILTGRLFVNITAIDWNGNETEETVILYENSDGLYLDLTSPLIDTTYETSINIAGTVLDYDTTPISIDNVDYIKWQLESDSCKLQIYPVETTDADNDGIIYNDTFQFNINDGTFSDSISMVGESGSQSFSFYAADLNGHVNEIDYNISDGNGSPDIDLDSTTPDVFTDDKRYLSIGDEISFSCHVGPTGKTVNELSYRVSPGDGTSAQTISFSSYSGDDENGYTFYFEKNGIDTTNYDDTAQILILDCTALGASESSSENIFFTADNDAPEVYRHSVASGTDEKNTYVDFEITDSSDIDSDPDLLWGSKYRASSLTASDLEIVKLTSPTETIAISSIMEITDFDSPVPEAISGGTGTFRIYISNKDNISYRDGLTDYTLRSKSSNVSSTTVALDKANNILTDYNFVFLDEAAPVADTLTPANGAVTSFSESHMTLQFDEGNLSYSGAGITVTKDGTPSTVTGSISTTTLTDDTLSIPFPGGEGVYTVTVPSGAVTDISDNSYGGITAAEWTFTVDTEDPSVDSITAQIGGVGTDVTGTLIPAPSSDIVFTINLSDTSALSKGSGTLMQLVRSSSSDVDINMSLVTLTDSTATVSVNSSYFSSDEDYSLRVLEGAFTDAASNPSSLTNGSTFTVDADPPSIDSITAEIGGAGGDITGTAIQAPSSDIEFTISMSDSSTISKGSGNLMKLVRSSSSDVLISMDDVTLTDSTATVTVDKSKFTSDEDYNLQVLAGAFTDSASNTSVLTNGNTFELDGTAPSIETITAKIGGAGSDITGSVIQAPSSNIQFTITLLDNTALSKGSGNLMKLVRSSSSDVLISMDDVTLSGSTATVTVNSSNFTSDEDYNLQVLAGAFTDAASNSSLLTNGDTFKVDDTPPSLTSITAKIGGAGSDITGTTITTYPASSIEFTINLSDTSTLSKGSGDLITLVRSSSDNVSINMSTVTLSGATATVTVSKDNFISDEDYHLRLLAGAFTDEASNSLSLVNGDSFTIDTAPYVVTTDQTNYPMTPENSAYVDSSTPEISFYFDEDVTGESGSSDTDGIVKIDDESYDGDITAGNKVTVDLSSHASIKTLSDGVHSISIGADAFKDKDGTENGSSAFSSGNWSFTVDTTAPSVNDPSSPASGTVITSTGTFTVSFNLTDDTFIYEKSGGSSVIFDCTSGSDYTCSDVSVTTSGAVTVSVSTTSLAEDKTYNLTVNAGEFVDSAGNANDSRTSTWSITINTEP